MFKLKLILIAFLLMLISQNLIAACRTARVDISTNDCIENPIGSSFTLSLDNEIGLYSSFDFTTSINRGVFSAAGYSGSYPPVGILSFGDRVLNINYGEISGRMNTAIQSYGGIFDADGLLVTPYQVSNINYGVIRLFGEGTAEFSGIASMDNSIAQNINYGSINIDATSLIIHDGLPTVLNSAGIIASGAHSIVSNYGSVSIKGSGRALSALNYSQINNFGTIFVDDTRTIIESYYSYGIIFSGNSPDIVNSGSLAISGKSVRAVFLDTGSPNGSIFNSGTISARGENSYAIYISSGSPNGSIFNSGTISARGENSYAIYIDDSNNNVINLQKGSVIIGDIFAYPGVIGTKLNFNLGAGASYDYSVTGPWTIADLNGRPMITGSAHAAGIGNVVTTSQTMYERTSQINQSMDDRLRSYNLKQNTDQPYWINTYYSDSGRGGQGLLGSNLSFNQYRSGVTAGFQVKNSYTPTEIIVNYEHGTLNIDEGNQGISSTSVMIGALLPDMTKVWNGTLSAKAFLGYSDLSGDRKVLTNDQAYNGFRNVTASYQATHLNIGAAWTKTLYQTDKMTLDTLVGVDLNTQHTNGYSESDLFTWKDRTLSQLQERAQLGLETKPFVNPLTLFGRVGIERRDLISGENQNYTINQTAVSYSDSNQRNTYATLNAGAYYPITPLVKAYAQVRYYDSTKQIDSLSTSVGVSGQF